MPRRPDDLVHDLPVLGSGPPGRVKRSRMSLIRAAVLVAVQLLIVGHVTHAIVAGRTLSPVEPSEAMATLELGQVNAGFVFFLLAILSTVVFGRFFCGWACHIVALQDLCGWIMKKLGVKPQPFRSRLLLLAPFVLALYMFAWPTFERVVLGTAPPFPGFSSHLITTDFWQTFPGPVFAALTFLTCGFVAVYMLGAKGFCTYGCPYGALFVVADKFSPTRIVVDEGCRQSGHCTATCTSNVRVNEEVKLHGMVVDPRCMKCMDCVSVCPNEALALGIVRAPLLPPKEGAAPRYVLGLGEEMFVAAACLVATLAFRGLYDGPPLLMAMGLGGITAFLGLKLWQLGRRATVRVQSLNLKAGGTFSRSGRVFGAVALAWIVFTAHSAFVQWHRAWGRHWLNRTEVSRIDGLTGAFDASATSASHRLAAGRAARHFALADRFGLVDVAEIHLGIAWTDLLRGDVAAAETRVRAAVALDPDDASRHDDLVDLLVARGRASDAVSALEAKLARVPAAAVDHFRTGQLLVHVGRLDDAARHFATSVKMAPENAAARYNLGGVLRRLGRVDESVPHLREAARLDPADAATRAELARALEQSGR